MPENELGSVLLAVEKEIIKARTKFKPFNSNHEGYAVILEELDELWAEIKANKNPWKATEKMERECIQVAAMAIRFIVDLGGNTVSVE